MFHKAKNESGPAASVLTAYSDEKPGDISSATTSTQSGRALIGPMTQVTGEILGEEDLHIEGTVIGSITFKDHAVSIGPEGRVEGDIVGHSLSIAGHVEGRLIASHRVIVHASASVDGEIHAPGLILEEGAAFHGTVDMSPDNPLLNDIFGSQADQRQSGLLSADLSSAEAVSSGRDADEQVSGEEDEWALQENDKSA